MQEEEQQGLDFSALSGDSDAGGYFRGEKSRLGRALEVSRGGSKEADTATGNDGEISRTASTRIGGAGARKIEP